jgi:pimeloyl-ACP methyl ester carboxylesterase
MESDKKNAGTTSKKGPLKPGNRLFLIGLLVSLVVLLLGYGGISVYGAYVFAQVPNRITSFKSTPADYDLVYQEVSFESAAKDNLTLRGWWLPNPGSDKAIIYVHGREQSRAERLYLSKEMWNMGYNLLFFDLRGHGLSDGDRYTYGQFESWDVFGAFNFVKSKGFAPQNIGLYGTSLGAATALLAMGHSPLIQTVFSDSSYASFEELAIQRIQVEKGVPSFFLPGIFMAGTLLFGFKVAELRPEVVLKTLSNNRHIFLTHGTADTLIPFDHFNRLKDAGGSNISGTFIANKADHAQAIELYRSEYMEYFETFFKANLGP